MRLYAVFVLSAVWITRSAFAQLATADVTPSPNSGVTVTEGSTLTHRSQVDTSPGQVYIYVGGSFPGGTLPKSIFFLYDFNQAGNVTGYMTPLLFERVAGEFYTKYVVAAIGQGFLVGQDLNEEEITFSMIEGRQGTPNADYTFGYVNALVDSNGNPTITSPGTVDMDNPADGGSGVGGPRTTNDWAVTNVSPTPVVALGTTFGASASNPNYVFWGSVRTYSAQAQGKILAQ